MEVFVPSEHKEIRLWQKLDGIMEYDIDGFIPIIIRALETVLKSLIKNSKEFETQTRLEARAILKQARIQRGVLEYRKQFCSDSERKWKCKKKWKKRGWHNEEDYEEEESEHVKCFLKKSESR